MTAPVHNFKLRDYQQRGFEHALARAAEYFTGDRDQQYWLYACPTGSGKTAIQLWVGGELTSMGKRVVYVTPSLEVVRSYLRSLGVDASGMTAAKMTKTAELLGIYTPVTIRNRYETAKLAAPDVVICDEAHRSTDKEDTVQGDLRAYWPEALWLGYTATPFRGTPKETKKLRDAWPNMLELATIPQLRDAGHISFPKFAVVPLLDDDTVTVSRGEFSVRGAGTLAKTQSGHIASVVQQRGALDRPTFVVVPSTEAMHAVAHEIEALGIPARVVHQKTKLPDRAAYYAECERCEAVLVTIQVLAEGADLPYLARLYDASPTTSPVAWLQRIGRIFRPKDERGEVYVLCRNLERWAFLLAGALPSEVIYEAQTAFEAPSKRSGFRSLGFERLGRFKPLRLPLANGCEGQAFMLVSHDEDGVQTEYCILATDTAPEPIAATRTNGVKPSGERAYGTWTPCEVPVGLEGFATSSQRGELSPKQANWWRRAARRHGLDPDAEVSRREFAALPVLTQTKLRLA